MSDWAVIHAFTKGKPNEAGLVALDDAVEASGGGSVSAGRDGRWYITNEIAADNPADAASIARERVIGYGIDPDRAAGVEVLAWPEMEYRAAQPTIPELLGAAEVGELLDVSRQRVHQLAQLPAFPEPLAHVRMGPLWAKSAIEAFARSWTRKAGRPAVATPKGAVISAGAGGTAGSAAGRASRIA